MATSLPLYAEIPYQSDSSKLFDLIADRPWAVFLDSGTAPERQGRYDILACDPYLTLETRGHTTVVTTSEGQSDTTDNPFSLLKSLLPVDGTAESGPFHGGAIGYFSYDLARTLERLPSVAIDEDQLPEMAVGLYDWALVVDHQDQKAWLASACHQPHIRQVWDEWVILFSQPSDVSSPSAFRVSGEIRSNLSAGAYASAFQRIQRYIREGDCYQVNLAQRFSVTTSGAPWTAYKRLRMLSSAPFGAYLNTPQVQVLSNSPERFLRVDQRQVETKPIKGTLPRLVSPVDDLAQTRVLAESEKDRAENLMIVDLLRNDISKNCALGSVKVPKLFDVESYATVHHLVSTIEGQLAEGRDAVDLLRGCFPGGSITGAPKLRAMEIIEELEPHRRGIYCGAIGYIGFDGSMDSNIAIRTLIHKQGIMRFWAGGGIVADSQMESEYQETYHKAAAMMELLKT